MENRTSSHITTRNGKQYLGPFELGKVHCCDCIEAMRLLPDKSVDCVITDPPYGVNYQGGHFHSGKVNIKRRRDKLLNDDNPKIYYDLFMEINRITQGPCYIFFSGTKAFEVYDAAQKYKFDIHALIIWNKTNATYAAMNSQYKQRHEPILYCKPKNGNTRWGGGTSECTVWDMPRNAKNEYHPTQKPVWLIERMIKNHKIDLVIDPFAGSGTTGVACARLGKRFLGFELNENYCKIANDRIEATHRGQTVEQYRQGQETLKFEQQV